MTKILNAALVCPAEYDTGEGRFTDEGFMQVKSLASELMAGGCFLDPVVLAATGEGAHLATARFLGVKLAAGGYDVIGTSMIDELNGHPDTWTGTVRDFLEAAIIGDPPLEPSITHIGNVVAVVSIEVIAAITGLNRLDEISPEIAYYPDID